MAAAPVGVGIAVELRFRAPGSGATATRRIPPTENGDAIRIAPQPQAAWHDVGKLMAEDGVQRFLVVVLAVEQQAFAAVAVAEEARGIHEAHRAGQAGDDVSGAARLRAIREAQAVAGRSSSVSPGRRASMASICNSTFSRMAAARRPRGRRCSRSQRRNADATEGARRRRRALRRPRPRRATPASPPRAGRAGRSRRRRAG